MENIEADAPPTIRTKPEILMETWGTLDDAEVEKMSTAEFRKPAPAIETWTKLKLPYQVPSCPPLPSFPQILQATKTDNLHHKSLYSANVCRIGDTVIKYGGDNIVDEAETLLFLAKERPLLCIPTVLAVWKIQIEEGTRYCMMTKYIEGIRLELESEVFAGFPVQTQNLLCRKISEQLQYIRALPSEGYYGRVHRQGWLFPPSGIDIPEPASVYKNVTGPYNSYQDFISALKLSLEIQLASQNSSEELHPSIVSAALEFLRNLPNWDPHEPKFTWIDPKFSNMIIRPIKGDDGKEDWEVFFLDWENCGWYPAWLQSMQIHQSLGVALRDRTKPPLDKAGKWYPLYHYERNAEIKEEVWKGFDPNPRKDIFALAYDLDWMMF